MKRNPIHQAGGVENLLKTPQELPQISREAHGAIMRAVRASRVEQGTERAGFPAGSWLFRFGIGFAALALTVAGVWLTLPRQKVQDPVVVASVDPKLASDLQTAWTFLGELSGNAPATLAKPLQNHLDNLSADLTKRTQSLLAYLPEPPVK